MTDSATHPPIPVPGNKWLKPYYFWRATFSLAWVAAALTLGKSNPAVAALLLVVYPAWDAAANLMDAQRNGGMKRNRTQALNMIVSSVTTVAVALALGMSMHAVLGVLGVWAVLAGAFQLATGLRRWKTQGAQWAMILSGAQSMLAGAFFIVRANATTAPSITDIVPYVAFGAFYFLVSAVWLAVSDMRRRNAGAAEGRQANSAPDKSTAGRLTAIALVVAGVAGAFAYTAGWLTPARLTPAKVVDSLAPPGGAAAGFRRNHAKGICFTGSFEANGAGVALSRAPMLAQGTYHVTGRFNLAGPNPAMADGTGRVRGLSLRIQAPDGQEWRTAMINAPVFPVATLQDFYAFQLASAKKDDPNAMKRFAAGHPSLGAFGAWARSAPFAESYAQDRFNSLNSFVLTNAQGQSQTVRWSFVPAAAMIAVPPEELKKRDPDFLFKEITERVAGASPKWTLEFTVAAPGDPTADPTKAWPEDRRKVQAGALVVSRIEAEADGPCRDINFDPTVLPAGMRTSDDPFPAARSAAYAVSYDRRTAEAKEYPRTRTEGKP